MSRIRNLALAGAATAAAVTLAAPPASAAATSIHSGSQTGPLFSGAVVATNLGTITVSTSFGAGSCTSSTMNGTIQSDGTGLNVTGASFTGCTGPTGSATVTAQNLPWNGGSVVYNPTSTSDGTITLSNFRVAAVFSGITCVYGGNISGPGYNPDHPNRPNTSVAQAQAKINGSSVSKVGGSFLCPGTATVTAAYQLVGAGGEQLWAAG